MFLASHFSPGLLPAGFQDGVVGVARVLLRQQRDVERPQQPGGPGRAGRKRKSPFRDMEKQKGKENPPLETWKEQKGKTNRP